MALPQRYWWLLPRYEENAVPLTAASYIKHQMLDHNSGKLEDIIDEEDAVLATAASCNKQVGRVGLTLLPTQSKGGAVN